MCSSCIVTLAYLSLLLLLMRFRLGKYIAFFAFSKSLSYIDYRSITEAINSFI